MLTSRSRPAPGVRAVISLFCAAVVFAASAGVLLVSSQRANDAAAGHRANAVAIEVDQVRLMINRSALDETIVRIGVVSDSLVQTDLERAADHRSATWAEAASRLAMIENPTPETSFLIDLLDVETPVLLVDLFTVAQDAHFANRSPNAGLASQDVDYLDHAYTLVLYEAFLAEIDRSGSTTSRLGSDDAFFITEEIAYVASQPGYLGPDPDAPLTDSLLLNEGAVASGRADEVNDLTAASNIWITEQWTRAWAAGSESPAPVPLVDVAAEAAQDVAIIRGAVDDRLSQEFETANAVLSAAEGDASTARLAAIATALAALGSLAACITLGWRRVRQTQSIAGTDALTGAGNRHRLDTASKKAERPDLTHHVVVVIDLDQFKMVNDTHGHSMGDRILIELTRLLRLVIEETNAEEHELVRLGGDEFAVTLHHNEPIDTTVLAAQLERVQHNVVTTASGEAIPLAFSFGYVEAEGSPSLPGLLDAADLKTYEDKRRRRQNKAADVRDRDSVDLSH